MSLVNAPANGVIAVTTELAQLYNKSLTDFVDKEDVTCIEVVQLIFKF